VSVRRLVLHLDDSRPIWSMPPELADRIRAELPRDWQVVVAEETADGAGDGGGVSEAMLETVAGAEVYMGYGMPEPLFEAAGPSLRWVHSGAAGVASALHPSMLRSTAVLTNSAGIHAEPIADTVLAAVLHFTRGLDWAVDAQRRRTWDKSAWESADAPVREVGELRVGIHGLGGIGSAVARRFVALGAAAVIGTRRRHDTAPVGVRMVSGDDSLARLAEESDVMVVTVPRTPATERSIDARILDRLPQHAIVVAVSRGGVVDENALAERLISGRLRGAALDVFAEEPLGAASPLWTLPNALITPHVSGASHLFWRRQADLILGNLGRYLAGAPLLNTVDKQAGY
jgi:phosphoglycerate dehydrogenase-like enzyme